MAPAVVSERFTSRRGPILPVCAPEADILDDILYYTIVYYSILYYIIYVML